MKWRTGKIEIVREPIGNYLGATQFKFRNRYYTAFGRAFVVAGRYMEEDYSACTAKKHYLLKNMNISQIKTGDVVQMWCLG